jgi:hypothetical protein
MTQEDVDNELVRAYKQEGKMRFYLGLRNLFIMFIAGGFIGWGANRITEGRKAQRELAESNRLVERYRERDAETARLNRELAERNQRLEAGVASIREIAGSASGNIRQAIGIISGVQSVLKTLEADGGYWDTGGAGGGSRGGVGD